MILILLDWIYILFNSFLFGIGFLKITALFNRADYDSYNDLPFLTLAGLAILGTITNLFSVFSPISWQINLGINLSSLFILIKFFPFIRVVIKNYFHVFRWYSYATLVIGITFASLQSIPNSYVILDELGYYLQAIQWLEKYPAVKGIGNLTVALTYNSAWHSLSALFGFHYLGANFFNDLNGFLYLMLLLIAIEASERIMKEGLRVAYLMKVLIFMAAYFYFRTMLVAISVDMSLGIFIFLILVSLIELSEEQNEKKEVLRVVVFVMACFVVILKLSGITLGLVILGILYESIIKKSFRLFAFYILVFLLMLIPYLMRNVITSGYLLSPLTVIDIFEVDWKMAKLTDESGLIGWDYLSKPFLTGISNIPYKNSVYSTPAIYKATWTVNPWYVNTLIMINFFAMIFLIYHTFKHKHSFEMKLCLAVIFISFLGYLFIIPNWNVGGIRTLYGIFFFNSCFVLSYFLINCSHIKIQQILPMVLILFLFCSQIKLFFNVEDRKLLLFNYFVKPPAFLTAQTTVIKVNNTLINVPISGYCKGSPIPCSQFIHKKLKMRGKTLQEGFTVR